MLNSFLSYFWSTDNQELDFDQKMIITYDLTIGLFEYNHNDKNIYYCNHNHNDKNIFH